MEFEKDAVQERFAELTKKVRDAVVSMESASSSRKLLERFIGVQQACDQLCKQFCNTASVGNPWLMPEQQQVYVWQVLAQAKDRVLIFLEQNERARNLLRGKVIGDLQEHMSTTHSLREKNMMNAVKTTTEELSVKVKVA